MRPTVDLDAGLRRQVRQIGGVPRCVAAAFGQARLDDVFRRPLRAEAIQQHSLRFGQSAPLATLDDGAMADPPDGPGYLLPNRGVSHRVVRGHSARAGLAPTATRAFFRAVHPPDSLKHLVLIGRRARNVRAALAAREPPHPPKGPPKTGLPLRGSAAGLREPTAHRPVRAVRRAVHPAAVIEAVELAGVRFGDVSPALVARKPLVFP